MQRLIHFRVLHRTWSKQAKVYDDGDKVRWGPESSTGKKLFALHLDNGFYATRYRSGRHRRPPSKNKRWSLISNTNFPRGRPAALVREKFQTKFESCDASIFHRKSRFSLTLGLALPLWHMVFNYDRSRPKPLWMKRDSPFNNIRPWLISYGYLLTVSLHLFLQPFTS